MSLGGIRRVPNTSDAGYARAAPGANANILTVGLTPKMATGIWRISVVLAVASVFNMTETDGTTAYTHGLNSSSALNAGDMYTFDVPHMGKPTSGTTFTYNFQVETDGIIRRLTVSELQDDAA